MNQVPANKTSPNVKKSVGLMSQALTVKKY